LRGINVSRNALAVFLVSGGIAGLAGAEQVLGVDKACHDNFSPRYGFDGIAVAMLAKNSLLASSSRPFSSGRWMREARCCR